jgi:arylsulfatase A-like enzyme
MKPRGILLVLTDDHAGWCMGCAGNREVQTPNMDFLAREGVMFTDATTPCPVCSPARASFWTGTIPSWHGVHDHLNHEGHPGIGEQPTLAAALQSAGYRTGQIGKWHCHTSEDNQPRSGFDSWFSQYAGTRARFGDQPFWDQDQRLDCYGYQAPIITDRAINFLREAAHDEIPFLCAVGYTDTHTPFTDAPPRLVARYAGSSFEDIPDEELPACHGSPSQALRKTAPIPPDAMAQYYAAATFVDEQLGRLLDELTSLSILDETLVIYTGDHGLCTGHHGIAAKGNSTTPQNFFDESLHIPLLARLPGTIQAGLRTGAAVDHCDTFRTILEFTGAKTPDDAPRPGMSWLRLASGSGPGSGPGSSSGSSPGSGSGSGGSDGWDRDAVIAEYGNARMIRTERYKLIRRYPGPNGRFPDELYDRQADPRETQNIIEREDNQDVLAVLDGKLESYFQAYSHPGREGRLIGSQPRHNRKEPWRVDPAFREDPLRPR